MTQNFDRPGSTCGACERADDFRSHTNAAGLPQIEYRIGDHGLFLRRMLGWISRQTVAPNDPTADKRPLASLSTRSVDEASVALFDAWACVLDVLTFYSERIANEGFLRTAVERRSVLELARAIGYELAPGVAAATRLSFTLLTTPQAPDEVQLAAGLQVQSVPGPGELPQTYETAESVLARPEWNAMLPAQRQAQVLKRGDDTLYLAGLSTGLREGNKLLIVGRERLADPTSNVWDFRTVVQVVPDKAKSVTWVKLDMGIGWRGFGGTRTIEAPEDARIYAFAKRASVFGQSAPDPRMFSASMRVELSDLLDATEWKNFALGSSVRIHLAPEVPELVPGDWLVFEDPDYTELYRAKQVEAAGRTAFSLSLKTTRVTIDSDENLKRFEPRTLTVHTVTRELAQATRPLADTPVEGSEIVLDSRVPELEPGRVVLVCGRSFGAAESVGAAVEAATVTLVVHEVRWGSERSVLRLSAPLLQHFDRSDTRILGNVARATHGKTVAREVLGSGDGSKPFQVFALRQSPLTYISGPSGIASTLTVRIGGVAWTPVASTFDAKPQDHVYVPRIDDDGVTTINFGDGHAGARLPTGSENVTASYRVGLGAQASVAADKLTVLKTRPQGVKAVTNPLASSGAEDPEVLADARSNAPVTVLTLDRLVSVLDYQNYARAYPGIGKAQAVRLWDGRRHWLQLTVATREGAALNPSDDLYRSLTADIDAQRDALQRVLLDTFAARNFKLRATLRIDPAYVPETVIAAVDTELRQAYAFEQRSFGQVVAGTEIFAVAHRVPGVRAIDLDALWFADEAGPRALSGAPATWVLPARAARFEPDGVKRAELLLLDAAPDALELREAGP